MVVVIKVLSFQLSGPNPARSGQAKEQIYWLAYLKKLGMPGSRSSSHAVMILSCPLYYVPGSPWPLPLFRGELPAQWLDGCWQPQASSLPLGNLSRDKVFFPTFQ